MQSRCRPVSEAITGVSTVKRLLCVLALFAAAVVLLSCAVATMQDDPIVELPADTAQASPYAVPDTDEPTPSSTDEPTPAPTDEPEPYDLSRYEAPMLAMQDVLREYVAGNLTRHSGSPAPTPPLNSAAEARETLENERKTYAGGWHHSIKYEDKDSFLAWSYWEQSYHYASPTRYERGYDENLIPEDWTEVLFELAPGRIENGKRVLYPAPVRFYDWVYPDRGFMFGDSYDGWHCIPEEFGYALLDLDGDNSPELILLATMKPFIRYYSYSGGTDEVEQDEPYWIFGIYTVKHGQLVCSLRSSIATLFRLGKNGKIYGSGGIQFDWQTMRLGMRKSDGAMIAEEYYVEHSYGPSLDGKTHEYSQAFVDSKGKLHWLDGTAEIECYKEHVDWDQITFISIGQWIVEGRRDYTDLEYDYTLKSDDPPDYFIPNDAWRPVHAET